jgi:hypothetical protein
MAYEAGAVMMNAITAFAGVLALLGLFAFGFKAGNDYRSAHAGIVLAETISRYEAQSVLADTAHRAALQAETERARQAEGQHAARMAELDKQHTEAMNHAKQDAAALSAAVRAGERRLRERFTCAATDNAGAGSGADQTGRAAGLGNAATQGGLSAEDADVFIRLAAEADQVAMQLSACQAIITNDRATR